MIFSAYIRIDITQKFCIFLFLTNVSRFVQRMLNQELGNAPLELAWNRWSHAFGYFSNKRYLVFCILCVQSMLLLPEILHVQFELFCMTNEVISEIRFSLLLMT